MDHIDPRKIPLLPCPWGHKPMWVIDGDWDNKTVKCSQPHCVASGPPVTPSAWNDRIEETEPKQSEAGWESIHTVEDFMASARAWSAAMAVTESSEDAYEVGRADAACALEEVRMDEARPKFLFDDEGNPIRLLTPEELEAGPGCS